MPELDARTLVSVVDGFYAAATGQADWRSAIDEAAGAMGFSHWSVYATDRQAWAVATPDHRLPLTGMWSRSYDAEAQRDYERDWYRLAPNRQHYIKHLGRQICHDYMLLRDAEMDRHAFYDWAERVHGVRYMAVAVTDPRLPIGATLGLTRARAKGPISESELAGLDVLLEHFERSVQLEYHVGKALAPDVGAIDFLDRNPTGLLILDGLGRIVLANRAVRRMAERRDGFAFDSEALRALHARDDTGLQKLLAGVLGAAVRRELHSGGSARLRRSSQRRDYVVSVSPLSRRESILSELMPAACVLIVDPDATETPPSALLQQLYGLTRAELRLIERLIAGDTPQQAALSLGVSLPTVRTQLAAMFRKTDTTRQVELIRMVSSLPWWSHRGDDRD